MNVPDVKTAADLVGFEIVEDDRVKPGTVIFVNNQGEILKIYEGIKDLMGIYVKGGYIELTAREAK